MTRLSAIPMSKPGTRDLHGVNTNKSGDWVIGGSSGTLLTSSDEVTWTPRTSHTNSALWGVCDGDGLWLTTGATGVIISSTDTTTWVTRQSGYMFTLYDAIYDGTGLYVIVGDAATHATVLTSPDGVTWTQRPPQPLNPEALTGIAYDAGLWVAVGDLGTIITSTDPLNPASWVAQTSGVNTHLLDITYDGTLGLYVAVGNADVILTSPDGANWTRRQSGTTNQNLQGVASDGIGHLVIAGTSGTILRSDGALNWTSETNWSVVANDLQDVATGPGIAPTADLAITKAVNNPAPFAGQNVLFTITARNNGPANATGVRVLDVLPAGYSLVGARPSKGTFLSGLWRIGSLTNGQSATLLIMAKVNPTGSYSNIAQIQGSQTDPDPSNNTATIGTVPEPLTDLLIRKIVDDTTPIVGAQVSFLISASNQGPSPATGVTVYDTIPSGYTLISSTPSQGIVTSGVWAVGSLANGATATLRVVATVNATGAYSNTAVVSGDQSDSDSSNNTSSVTPQPIQQADLVITKAVNNSNPDIGSTIRFQITARNAGPSTATGVAVADTLPSGYAIGTLTPSQGTVSQGVWSVGQLANGGIATLDVIATVQPTGNYTNIASVDGDQVDPDPGNNLTTRIVIPTVVPPPSQDTDLSVNKTASNPSPGWGESLQFIITASNQGPATATGVKVYDLLPSGYSLVSSTPSIGTFNNGVWDVGSVANGDTRTLSLTVTVRPTGSYTNTAIISGDQRDPNSLNNASQSTPVPLINTDLSITKTVDNSSPNVGTNVTFTLVVRNQGPANATGVTVYDTIPSGYTLVSSSPSQGTVTSGVWTVGDLANNATATLNVVATIRAAGAYSNAAIVSGNQPDPESSNNTSTVTPVPGFMANLGVIKTVDNSTPATGETITFSVQVTNGGPSAASQVTLADALPSGYSLISAVAEDGTYSNGFGR